MSLLSGPARRPDSRWKRLATSGFLTLACTAGLIGAGGPVPGQAEPPPPPDAFYDAPAGFAAAAPGTVLKSRTIAAKAMQLFPIRAQAWQLLYRTKDAAGKPDTAVTTVLIPDGPRKPRPLLSFQSAIDSTLRICNPSYGLQHGLPIELTNPPGPVTFPVPAAEVTFAAAGLEQGWAVAMPDHGSTTNRFLTPRQPGYAILDGIRAATSFAPLGLEGPRTKTALWGYSGGGIASSWAAELQPSYAPEINLVGAALGAPVPDLAAAFRAVGGHLLGGLIPLALNGIVKDSPEFAARLNTYLTPAGQAAVAKAANHCIGQNVLDNLWFDPRKYLTASVEQVLADPVISKAITERNRGHATPKAPLYVYNGITEEVSPIGAADALVNTYCARGTAVTYRRDEFPDFLGPLGSTHGVVAVLGAPDAFAWLKERVNGTSPKPAGCDIKTVPSTLLSPAALATLGPSFIANTLLTILGLPIGAGR